MNDIKGIVISSVEHKRRHFEECR